MEQITKRKTVPAKIIALLSRIGANPNDSENLRLRKLLFVISVLFFATPPSIIGGIINCTFGEPLAGSLMFTFAALGLLIVVLIKLMPRYYPFLMSFELLNVLVMPYVAFLILGGLNTFNVTIVWSFMCPLGALVMTERRVAFCWFVAFLVLFGSLYFVHPFLPATNNLPPIAVLRGALFNLAGTSVVTFLLLYYFVLQRDMFQGNADNLLLNILPEEIAKMAIFLVSEPANYITGSTFDATGGMLTR